MRMLEDLQPVLTEDRNQTDFKNLLEYSLNRLIGDHDQLKSALEQLHSIILEELKLENKESNLSALQSISDRCQKQINTLKNNKALGKREFEELDQILNQVLYYANLTKPTSEADPTPILCISSRSKFLSIIHQSLNNILLEIQKGFKFQDEKSDQEKIKGAIKIAQEEQNKNETEHDNQPQSISEPLLQRLRRQGPQTIFAALEFFGITVIPPAAVFFGTHASAVYLYLSIFVPGPVALCAESASFLYNRRSLGTNLSYTLPSWLISRFTNTVEQYEIEPLLRNNAPIINSGASINSTSYGSIPNQLEQNLSNDNSNIHIEFQPAQSVISNVSQAFPEAPSPAAIDFDLEKSEEYQEITMEENAEPQSTDSLALGN